MSQYHGMLLFDIADSAIGNWEEDLGGRGVYDKWNLKDTAIFLRIDDDDPPLKDSSEVWIGENSTGNQDSLFFGPYKEAVAFAKEFMNRNKDATKWSNLK